MLPFLEMRVLTLVATLWVAIAPALADPELRMPPGTRTDPSGQRISGRGLREATDFLAKELDKKGIAVKKIGPYRMRGVELTRFLSQTPSTTWLALHVVRTAGKTVISFVLRPPT